MTTKPHATPAARGRRIEPTRQPTSKLPGVTQPGHACSHCGGSGREPFPLQLSFSRSGDDRGKMRELADDSGIHLASLSRTFAGLTVPSLPTVILLASALEVSESRLIHHPPIWHRALQELADRAGL